MKDLKKNIKVAIGEEKADVVLKNPFIINVFTQSIEKHDIAICGDTIVGIGAYNGEREIDCTGYFVCPGFIDAHVHIESSMVIPEIFSSLVIKRGVTTVVADPHEIANALGTDGLQFMLENGRKSGIDVYYMLPSCVPATEFEDNGAVLGAEELSQFISDKAVLGLGEVMDVPAVIQGNDKMLEKVYLAEGKYIDGHCPEISESYLNAYIGCGIRTDHECSTYEEALKKVQRGMYVMLREGSAAKNLKSLLPAVNKNNYSRFLFCTDDRHIEDLLKEGTIDNAIRIAIEEGLEPVKAITIATLNAATCYGLRDRGAIAPGYKADLVIFQDLTRITVKHVMKAGMIYEEPLEEKQYEAKVKTSMNIDFISEEAFKIEKKGEEIHTIKVIPHSLETKKERRKVTAKKNFIDKVIAEDILKIGVFERYNNTGKKAVGFIEGLGLKNCAIAQTIAHDSHNIIVIGDKDKDMEVAVNALISMGGGIILVSEGKVVGELSLPIGGLMTAEEPEIVVEKLARLSNLARQHGVKRHFDPFLTLGFMALAVIPEIKITARGLFDYNKFEFIDLFIK